MVNTCSGRRNGKQLPTMTDIRRTVLSLFSVADMQVSLLASVSFL